MSTKERIGPRRAAWEKATAWPMLIIALVFLIAYSIHVLAPDEADPWRPLLVGVLVLCWAAFAIDYVVRLALSPHGRWAFIRHNLADLAAVFLPVFRVFRLMHGMRDIPYFRRRSGDAVRTRLVAYAATFAILYVYMIALAELSVERGTPGATITSFGDAVWWACVTMATVGYGDTYPVTAVGRFFAVLLMIGGIAIVGVASATVISYVNESVRSRHHDEED